MITHHTHVRTLSGPRLVAAAVLLALAVTTVSFLAPMPLMPHAAAATWVVDTTVRTEADVRARWEQLKPIYTGAAYATTPKWDAAPYAPGSTQAGFVNDGLRMINFGRYLAGVPSDVVLDATKNLDAQYGAVLLKRIDFDHIPSPKPADMDQAFYDRGVNLSTSKSNIGSGYLDSESFQKGCLADASASNLPMVGHRRWLLNPRMKVTGIGFAENFHTTYATDTSRIDTVQYDYIAWPSAGIFPTEFMTPQTPWSITLNPDRYDWDASGFTVTLRRVSDGRVWTFNAADTNAAGEYFNASFDGFGVRNAFIFRPDPATVTYGAGTQFDVTFTGGIYAAGTRTPVTVSYRTSFGALSGAATTFAAPLQPGQPEPEPEPEPEPTPTLPGGGIAIENDAPGVTFGRFITAASPAFSGGSYTYAYSKAPYVGTTLEATFFGDTVRWIGPKQPSYGKANVYIDGVLQGAYDCYAASGSLAETIFEKSGMTDGWHTITIEMRSDKNAASTGHVVVVDRFEADGADPAGGGFRACDSTGSYAGGWVRVTGNPTYTNSCYAYSYWAGASFRYTFTGTRVAWIGPKVYNYGRAAVYVDGVYQGTVSQYAPTSDTQFRAKVWESAQLPAGNHTLEIRPLGTKDAASAGSIVVIDGIDYLP